MKVYLVSVAVQVRRRKDGIRLLGFKVKIFFIGAINFFDLNYCAVSCIKSSKKIIFARRLDGCVLCEVSFLYFCFFDFLFFF